METGVLVAEAVPLGVAEAGAPLAVEAGEEVTDA